MARRMLDLGHLNALSVGQWYKPEGTLGRHQICKLANNVFVNHEDVVFQIPSSFKGNKVQYDCGNLCDPAESLADRFESWKTHQLAQLEQEISTLESRYARDYEAVSLFSAASVHAFEQEKSILSRFQELNSEWSRIKKMSAPKKPVTQFVTTPMTKLEIFNKFGVSLF